MISSSGRGSGRTGQRRSRQSHVSKLPCVRVDMPGGGRGGTIPSGGATLTVASLAAVGGACSGISTGGCSRGRPLNAPPTRPRLLPTKLTELSSRGGGALGARAELFLLVSALLIMLNASGSKGPCPPAACEWAEAESVVSLACIARLKPCEAGPVGPP